MSKQDLDFNALVDAIANINEGLASRASKAVNISLTLRNWLIGSYISEYELNGSDRAAYGERLLIELSQKLTALKINGTGRRQLYKYLALYRTYPEIVHTVPAQLGGQIQDVQSIVQKVRTPSAQLAIPPTELIESLSYSHLELLIGIADEFKRRFYEIECIRGNWSVRELKRQISSLYYERSGLSKDKRKLAELAIRKQRPIRRS